MRAMCNFFPGTQEDLLDNLLRFPILLTKRMIWDHVKITVDARGFSCMDSDSDFDLQSLSEDVCYDWFKLDIMIREIKVQC